MIHQPYGGVGGTSADIELQAKEILERKKILSQLMARFTGQTVAKILEDSERDFYMDAQAGQKYGIVDHIAEPTAHAAPKVELASV